MSIHSGWQPMVKIGNFPVPEPSTYDGNTATLVDSARNAAGYVVGSVIRNDIAKVSISWKYITASDWASILQQFSPRYGGNFYNNVTFFDQVSNAWVTRQMYVSDREAGVFKRNADGSIAGYTGASLSLVEV